MPDIIQEENIKFRVEFGNGESGDITKFQPSFKEVYVSN